MARSLVGRLLGRVRSQGGAVDPVSTRVSLVVILDGEPVAARRLLDGALAQRDVPVEIVVVVLLEALLAMAREQSVDDSRVRVLDLVGTDRAGARRRGVEAARAPAVLVLVPGAELTPGAVARLVARREETGAGVVVGDLVGSGIPTEHFRGLTDLETRPEVARVPLLARLLVERSVLSQRIRDPDDADGTVTALGLLDDGFVVEPSATVRDVRPGTERVLVRLSPWSDLDDRLAAIETGDTLLAEHPAALAARHRGLLGRDLLDLAEAAEDATEQQWRGYVTRLEGLLEVLGAESALRALPVEPRVLLWLAASGVRADVLRWVAARRLAQGSLPTEVVDGRVRAVAGPSLPLPAGAPAYLLELPEHQLVLRARLSRLRVVDHDLEIVVQAGITHLDQADPAQVRAGLVLVSGARRIEVTPEVRPDADVTRWLAERGQDHDAGSLVARVPLTALGPDEWRLEVDLEVCGVGRRGVVGDLDPRGSAERAFVSDDPVTGADVVGVTLPVPATGVLRDVHVGDALEVTATGPARTAELVGEVTLPGVDLGGGRWRFALVASTWSGPVRPAPSGAYRLHLDGAPVPAEGVLDRLPEEHLIAAHRVLLRAGPGGNLVVRLAAPLADAELGARAQQRLQTAYARTVERVSEPVEPGLVYLQSFTGSAVNDNPAAIAAELLRRRDEVGPGLRVRWAVADSAADVPPGTEAVLIRSREWYDVLARASHLVTNVDLEPWFVRRPAQQVLQTSHGYPFKRMGLDQWRGRGFPQWRIEQELARSSGTWTAVITPQTSVDSFYREQYAFEGRILATGYPRDDVLTDPRTESRRAEARRRIGAGSRKVLLYAPTWRDDLATDHRAALATHFVDLGELSRRLGDDWLLLRRGHRFHAPGSPGGADADGPGVLDVTAYPEVNDLMLAADAALLEYSSMRFDFALTGRPAVYFVPDLDRYAGEVRGFLHDYRDTAPGPLVETLDEVVEELRDLDALTARWSGPIAELNATWSSRQDGHASERAVSAFFADLLTRP